MTAAKSPNVSRPKLEITEAAILNGTVSPHCRSGGARVKSC